MNSSDLDKSIELAETLLEQKNILYMPDITRLKLYKEHPERFEGLMPYINGNIEFSIGLVSLFPKLLFTPFLLASKILRKFLALKRDKTLPPSGQDLSSLVISSGMATNVIAAPSRETNDSILEAILDIAQEEADTVTFGEKVRDLSYSKFETNKRFAEMADIDYAYLNKLINGKLRPNATISRDLAIKICLALELDLLEANELLSLAGYILCGSTKRDRILSICVQQKAGVIATNEVLLKREQSLL